MVVYTFNPNTLRRLIQEDLGFEASLGYIVSWWLGLWRASYQKQHHTQGHTDSSDSQRKEREQRMEIEILVNITKFKSADFWEIARILSKPRLTHKWKG
jgi:hypothetical protein